MTVHDVVQMAALRNGLHGERFWMTSFLLLTIHAKLRYGFISLVLIPLPSLMILHVHQPFQIRPGLIILATAMLIERCLHRMVLDCFAEAIGPRIPPYLSIGFLRVDLGAEEATC